MPPATRVIRCRSGLCLPTLYQHNAPFFNRQVDLLNNVVLEPDPYTFCWRHRGFWRCKSRFLAHEGVHMHLNTRGNYKYFRSLTGALLRCMRKFMAQ